MFHDREHAGRELAARLARLGLRQPIVLALPRGGVPIGAAIASALDAPLDLIMVRKVGAPGNPELAVAAIVEGDPPEIVLNRETMASYGLSDDQVAKLAEEERRELERRQSAYRGNRKPASVGGKTVIVVDDGAATGTTMKAVLKALKHRSPREIVVALPVAPPETVRDFEADADRVICLSQPRQFMALGYHYERFPQLSDAEVMESLDAADRRHRNEGDAQAGPAEP
jgi:putative phosphoribosyl transferase